MLSTCLFAIFLALFSWSAKIHLPVTSLERAKSNISRVFVHSKNVICFLYVWMTVHTILESDFFFFFFFENVWVFSCPLALNMAMERSEVNILILLLSDLIFICLSKARCNSTFICVDILCPVSTGQRINCCLYIKTLFLEDFLE